MAKFKKMGACPERMIKSQKKAKTLRKSSNNHSLLVEVWDFLNVRKAWWLVPIIVMLILVGILIVFSQSSAVSPFIYALF